jgi:hypothetical protein
MALEIADGWIPENDDDFLKIWNAMPEAKGYKTKEEPIKIMRWFSSNKHIKHERLAFWITKMLLVWEHGKISDDKVFVEYVNDPADIIHKDPRKELQQLRENKGGWQLAKELMTPHLLLYAKIYYWISKAQWTWYTTQCREITTPEQGLAYFIRCSLGQWRDDELADHFNMMFETEKCLNELGLDWGSSAMDIDRQQKTAQDFVDAGLHIAGNRIFSYLFYEAVVVIIIIINITLLYFVQRSWIAGAGVCETVLDRLRNVVQTARCPSLMIACIRHRLSTSLASSHRGNQRNNMQLQS